MLINELSAVAVESIEKAAAEAARAVSLAAVEREAELLQARASALRDVSYYQAEAFRWRTEAETGLQQIVQVKKSGVKNVLLSGIICFIGGLFVGRAMVNSK